MIVKIHFRGIIIGAALIVASLPLSAGTLYTVSGSEVTPINAGTYGPGETLNIQTIGAVDLLGTDGTFATRADGSIIEELLNTCVGFCWSFVYKYANEGATTYSQLFGGDGTNHFVGGGLNFDKFPGDGPAFAPEGKRTTNTEDSGAIRFGALAGTFVANPDPMDWFLVGYGGTFYTGSGGTLQLVVVDTYYMNNTGGYNVTIDPIPEPAAMGLAFSGLLLLGGVRLFRPRRQR